MNSKIGLRAGSYGPTALGILFFATVALALDPPHDYSRSVSCSSCHLPQYALGDQYASMAGNANLCLSCHHHGGAASATPLAEAAQAIPWPGVGTNLVGSGTSHRWDANPSGRVVFMGNRGSGADRGLIARGVYAGRYAQTYTITITTAGSVGTARFNWLANSPGSGSGTNLPTGYWVPIQNGLQLSFMNYRPDPAFAPGDQWQVFVRPNLSPPANPDMQVTMDNGKVVCSTCHDQHSQELAPFDPAAPNYLWTGTGSGRHFMRAANNSDQMCKECHGGRFVTNSLAGSHPVGGLVATNAFYHPPTSLPLDKAGRHMWCSTCHDVHRSPSIDGSLVRATNEVALCTQCHALANTTTPAAHFSATPGLLWPGGQYGSLFPRIFDTAQRGQCGNCHQAHGWPDPSNPTNDFPKLLVETEENLCFTCHDANGPAAKNVKDDFAKLRHHPINDTQQAPGRVVECTSCHNAHKALSGSHIYTNNATASRNLASNPLKGVSGVAFNYGSLTNFQPVTTNLYTSIDSSTGATYEYQICFKCHSSFAWSTGTLPKGLSPNGSAATPVETDAAQEFSPRNKSGHPIVTGLDNYPNSIAVGSPARKGLQPAALLAPWNVNVGQQTMMCSDCHNTDAATPAAQGPHGSAAQFMLRGLNAANWPNVTLANFATSWCANCHVKNAAGTAHTRSDHSSYQCYRCHIVIPHGGKLSRLLADNDSMPARYAYNNTLNTQYLQSFTKAATNGYSTSSCKAQCTSDHSSRSPSENW